MRRGWIERRESKNGLTLRCRFWIPGPDGELIAASKSFSARDYPDKRTLDKAAHAFLAKTVTEINAGTFVVPNETTLRELVDRWIASRAVRPNSIRADRAAIKHLSPSLLAMPIQRVKPMHIQALYGELKTAKVGHAALFSVHRVLKAVFAQAMRWEMLTKSPADRVVAPRLETPHRPFWSPEQTGVFVGALQADAWGLFFRVLAGTGMRRGELAVLRWEDLDFKRNTIAIRRTMTKDETGRDIAGDTTKTANSLRTIPIPASCRELLTAHRRHERERQLAAPVGLWRPDAGDLVFSAPDGRMLTGGAIQRAFAAIVAPLGLPANTPHGLRRGFIVALLMQGAPPKTVSSLVGDDVRTVMSVYSQVVEGSRETAVDALDALLSAMANPDRTTTTHDG
jgi:integrase